MAGRNGLVIFIVDDQPTALETLASDLQQYDMVESIHCFNNYADATLPLIEMQPDVLFLDVEVPGRTGIDFIDSIKPHVNFTFKVVFYTAYSDYMLDAIRHAAYDYLLKPYKPEELSTVMERLHSESLEGNSIRTLPEEDASRKLAIQAVSELLLLRTEQILLFMYQPDSRSWRITLTDGTEHLLKKGLHADDLVALHSSLIRISNNCIINITYLAAVENSTQRCRLYPPFDHIELNVSRRYFSQLKAHFEVI